MKKVLYIYTERYGGGVQSVMNDEACIYNENLDIKAAFIGARDKDSDLRLRTSFFGLFNFFKIKKFIKREKICVIHFHGFFLLGLLLPYMLIPFAKRAGLKVFTTAHNYTPTCPSQKRYNFRTKRDCYSCQFGAHRYFFESCEDVSLYKKLAKFFYFYAFRYLCFSSDKVFYPSPFAKKHNHDATSNGVAIENPVNTNFIIDGCEHFGAGNTIKIGYLGRFTEEKGIKELALSLANNQRKMKGVVFHLAGAGPLKEDVIQILEGGNVDYFDFGFLEKDKVDEFYGSIDILVVPSLWHESFCLVGFEALLRHVPVLCSNKGEIGRFVNQYGVGETFFRFSEIDLLISQMMLRRSDYKEKLLSVSSWLPGKLSPGYHVERLRRYYDA
ncbi:MAG: hypothetical protein CMI02_05825 [Oceanospirillaceae bacterium]|nr:hypothetical protein [Oceanospirillaceae bacterium]MBU60578.1 hypothetical protein [Alcanivorax sp.]